jgi:hypothetical protein
LFEKLPERFEVFREVSETILAVNNNTLSAIRFLNLNYSFEMLKMRNFMMGKIAV